MDIEALKTKYFSDPEFVAGYLEAVRKITQEKNIKLEFISDKNEYYMNPNNLSDEQRAFFRGVHGC